MKNPKLDKYYEKMTNEEIIDLIVKAGKREDREEIKRLVHCYKWKLSPNTNKIDFTGLTLEELRKLAKLRRQD